MNTSSGNPFNYSSAMAKNNGLMPSSSRMALDNLLRRELKVSDPNDAKQIAEALLNRYKNNPRAVAINKEAEGVPFLLASGTPMPLQQAPTSSDAEMQQAIDDVNRDLQELTTNTILKDLSSELAGWAMAIRSAIQEGFNSARFALDSHYRDKTFGIRRNLGEYARLSRLVGSLSSPVVNVNYRNLAQSLDEVTSVLLVMMGEALANVGFNRSRYLLQVPYSELQGRRDSVIYALRNFIGSTQTAYAANEWPRGVDAYRQLYSFLDNQGQNDLRSLLVENELSRVMDSLIHRASQGNVEGLRHLGATAQLDVQRLRRLVLIGKNLQEVMAVNPASPPLDAFLQALQLFIDGFEGSGGFRLLRLARPPILFYGLYGSSANEETTENQLVELAFQRNLLAELLDCWLQCGCTSDRLLCQIIFDKILYDVDRAIDFYALGTAENREPEYRSLAYSYLIDVVINPDDNDACLPPNSTDNLVSRIRTTLTNIRNLLYGTVFPPHFDDALDPIPSNEKNIRKLVEQELRIQGDMESHWLDLVQTMAPACLTFGNGNSNGSIFNIMARLIQQALNRALSLEPGNDSNLSLRINTSTLFNTPPQYELSLRAEADASADISEYLETIAESLTVDTGDRPNDIEQ
ncbi:MAG: hypothetical protein EWV55_11760 [Microcystis viridis Mv_BB_P_19951000_S69]|uniref:Uncharacterized protein n=1 Tax=Microcystis viridis Mv_BB_P_19951000_S68D TaxID=2486270 RepID=A0A552HAR8_MICVR|nr:MAG: hypothetical protein EWV77_20435 [Microcystis viridis Mv_BB_P_19951000_S68D]TRU74009.1 MAG: hypothetical protein EWV47_11750 [Microcystis viridis Mv_BB_P_19951000_S68]TRU74073.1 MAG: hypothetical protein EWV55_11760 [Microcystis viridis Mv_BB_P_19951000_S69]TRU87540.1 MAG: hypothetical protein EWV46_07855 [Microcystis viridis Mv_BB_P_19951000_S69D]